MAVLGLPCDGPALKEMLLYAYLVGLMLDVVMQSIHQGVKLLLKVRVCR